MRVEDRQGRPTALRGASTLEMGEYRNEAASAVSESRSDAAASQQNLRTARVAAGESWICHRNIVNLKQSVARHAAIQAAPPGADVTIRSEPSCLVRQVVPGFRLQSPRAECSPRHRTWQAIRRVDDPPRPVRATHRPSHDGPGKTPRSTNERAGRANLVRIRNPP
jgi:hypothetical protein